MHVTYIEARDIPDAWFQCIYQVMESGREYVIDRGSYAGQKRREFEFAVVKINYPEARPLVPTMPEGSNLPPPTDMEFVLKYLDKLVNAHSKAEREDYTYGQYLEPQIHEVVRMYKEDGFGTNQACMAVCDTDSIFLADPPCLRQIDTRIYPDEKKLHFVVYFRSWDLWGGFPSNLAGIQLLKEYMADEIGHDVKPGETIAVSKGLHLYDMYFEVANMRLGKLNQELEHVRRFINSLGVLNYPIRPGDDPPDVITEIESKKVAIEVTGYYASEEMRASEAAWESLAETFEATRNKYRVLEKAAIRVKIGSESFPKKSEFHAFAESLCVFLEHHSEDWKNDEVVYRNLPERLGASLESVSISPTNCRISISATDIGAGSIGINEKELLRTVETKMRISMASGVDEYWLLIVAGLRRSQCPGIVYPENLDSFSALADCLKQGPFSRVFLQTIDKYLVWTKNEEKWSYAGLI